MGEESNRRTQGSRGNAKDKVQGKTRGGGRGPTWKERIEQGEQDKKARRKRAGRK